MQTASFCNRYTETKTGSRRNSSDQPRWHMFQIMGSQAPAGSGKSRYSYPQTPLDVDTSSNHEKWEGVLVDKCRKLWQYSEWLIRKFHHSFTYTYRMESEVGNFLNNSRPKRSWEDFITSQFILSWLNQFMPPVFVGFCFKTL